MNIGSWKVGTRILEVEDWTFGTGLFLIFDNRGGGGHFLRPINDRLYITGGEIFTLLRLGTQAQFELTPFESISMLESHANFIEFNFLTILSHWKKINEARFSMRQPGFPNRTRNMEAEKSAENQHGASFSFSSR